MRSCFTCHAILIGLLNANRWFVINLGFCTMTITSVEELRKLYAAPLERAVRKQLSALDRHCLRFIELSPFLVMATSSSHSAMDASPRGGAPGFVKAVNESTLVIPDAPGNNRLDSLENIVTAGRIGLLFLIPGVDETLRVNGRAQLSVDKADIERYADTRRTPTLVIKVQVEEVYLHCAKALMRSKLWAEESKIARTALPSAGQMLSDHTGIKTPPETQEEMRRRYAPDL